MAANLRRIGCGLALALLTVCVFSSVGVSAANADAIQTLASVNPTLAQDAANICADLVTNHGLPIDCSVPVLVGNVSDVGTIAPGVIAVSVVQGIILDPSYLSTVTIPVFEHIVRHEWIHRVNDHEAILADDDLTADQLWREEWYTEAENQDISDDGYDVLAYQPGVDQVRGYAMDACGTWWTDPCAQNWILQQDLRDPRARIPVEAAVEAAPKSHPTSDPAFGATTYTAPTYAPSKPPKRVLKPKKKIIQHKLKHKPKRKPKLSRDRRSRSSNTE